jgi:hypothetical protein
MVKMNQDIRGNQPISSIGFIPQLFRRITEIIAYAVVETVVIHWPMLTIVH